MPSDRALSETISITLIICLIIVLAIVIWGFVFGYGSVLKSNVNIAETAADIDTGLGAHAIRLFHENGNTATLNTSASAGYHGVAFTLLSPSGLTIRPSLSPVIEEPVWSAGRPVWFYRDATGYYVTDSLDDRIAAVGTYGPLVDLEGGIWTVRTIDTFVPVEINSLDVYIGGSGSASSGPTYSPGLIATYYSDQGWSTPVMTNIASRVYFADTASGMTSDVSNWPNPYLGKTESFSVRYEGLIRIATEDDYTFTLTSDDGSYMDFDGTSNFINNGGLHSSRAVTATKHLAPGYYPVTVRMYENTGQAVIYLQYNTPSTASKVITDLWHVPSTAPSTDFTGMPRAGPAPLAVVFTDTSVDATGWAWNFGDGSTSTVKNPSHTYTAIGSYPVTLTTTNTFGTTTATKAGYIKVGSFSPGFIASYYLGQDWTTLNGTRTESSIGYSDQSGSNWPRDMVARQENFSVMWDGYLNVPAESDYTFRLTSDDGSYLSVDETLLIDNGGLHSSRAYTATTHLTTGYHHIVVKMYENTGVAVAALDYTIPPSTTYSAVTNVYHV